MGVWKSDLNPAFRSSFAEDIFQQKYAHEGAQTWEELCNTLVDDVCQTYMKEDEKDQLKEYMKQMAFIPGGRYLYYAGRERKFFNNCFSGDTKVLTLSGWKTLAENVGKTLRVISPVDGLPKEAKIHEHGEQELQEIVFKPLKGKSLKTYTVYATRSHHWVLENGSDTYDLRVNDVIPANKVFEGRYFLGFLHGLIFGDGNLEYINKKDNKHVHKIRLCDPKQKKILDWLIDNIEFFNLKYTLSYPKTYKGDPLLRIWLDCSFKALPLTTDIEQHSAHYIGAFLQGWVFADGSKIAGKKLCSINEQAIDYFIENAAMAGYVVSGEKRFQIRDTQFKTNHKIFIINFSLGKDWTGFKVVSIRNIGKQKVYCPYEPEHGRIIIDHGIDTFNCYLLKALEDNREDWAELSKKAELCLSTGGGIGVDYSIYRGSGSLLRGTGGYASGPIAKMEMLNEIGRFIMQGGSRRSAIYASLSCEHSDINKFLDIKNWYKIKVGGTDKTLAELKEADFNARAPLDMTNISVNYGTKWLCDYWNTGDYGKTFLKNCEQTLSTSEPGFSFNFFTQENETLRNACVSGDTLILTRAGHQEIQDLVGKEVEIWNGECWSKVTPFSTGINPTVKVVLTDGAELICTDYHKFILANGARACADELQEGDKLHKFEMPVVDIGEDYPIDAYSQGFYAGDGNRGLSWSSVYFPKFMCENRLQGKIGKIYINRKRWVHGPMYDKDFVPVNGNKKYCLNWLAGLCDSDGTVTRDKNGNGIQIVSVNKDFLNRVRLMLTRLGCRPKVVFNRDAGFYDLPDGNGGLKAYNCKAIWRLLIGNTDTYFLLGLGLKTERLEFHKNPPQRDARRFVAVQSISFLHEIETFCFTEPLANRGTFNGVVTGQCCEITSEDDSDVCNLGSINLSRIDNIYEFTDVVNLATKFLVCGTLGAHLPYQKVYDVRAKNRRLGLGLMGLHEWLVQRGSGYEVTPELHKWLTIYRAVSRATANTFAIKCSVSNPVACRAIAPTGSIGILAGTTTGIEPIFAVAYKRRYLKGTRWHSQYVVDGAAQDLISRYEVDPESLETALDLADNYEKRIKFQADIQDYVDQGISSTINLPKWGSDKNNPDTVKPFADCLASYAHRLRGLTCYADSSRGGQPIVAVPYSEAVKKLGEVFEEAIEYIDICELTQKGGTCGN